MLRRTPLCVVWSLAVLVWATAARSAPEAPSTAPRWALPATQVDEDKPFEAWLTIPHPQDAPENVRAVLVQPAGVTLWWSYDKPCSEPPNPLITDIGGMTGSSTRACGVMREETSFRIVAVVRFAKTVSSDVAASDLIAPKPAWQIPATVLAVLGLIGGWIAGVLTPAINHASDKRTEIKNNRIELIKTVATQALPELELLRTQLRQYAAADFPPENLQEVRDSVYNVLADDDGIVSRVLPKEERQVYLEPFFALYQEVQAFNRALSLNQRDKAKAAAQRGLPRVEALLSLGASAPKNGGAKV